MGSGGSGSGYGAGGTASSASTTTSSASGSGALSLQTSTVGGQRIVVDGRGVTVYFYTLDKPGETKSACTGGCASLWPAVTSDTAPKLQGVTGKTGTVASADGRQQVTINGMPIYYYAKDTGPGQAHGQGVAGVWYVVGSDGSMIQTPLTAASGTPGMSGSSASSGTSGY
ncbi:COG4315 family predicted lipoprotein [Sinomonas atrocyanea]|nr:hypothetical protein [Sinomonas atrocyanea]